MKRKGFEGRICWKLRPHRSLNGRRSLLYRNPCRMRKRRTKMGHSLPPVLALATPAYGNRVRVNVASTSKKVPVLSPTTEEVGEEESNAVPTCHTVIRRHRSEKTSATASLSSQECRDTNGFTKKKKTISSWTPALGFAAAANAEMAIAMGTFHRKPMQWPQKKYKKSSQLRIGINKQRLESFANLVENFRYAGNNMLQEPLSIAAIASNATSSSTVQSVPRNCVRAASSCLEESMLWKKSSNTTICTAIFKPSNNITTRFTCKNTTMQNSGSSVSANPPLIAGHHDEACWDLPTSVPQRMKLQKAAQVNAPCQALAHESASQKTKIQRKTALPPTTEEGDRLPKSLRCKCIETMTKAEKMQDAYRRVSPESTWVPPNSPYELLQEDHAFDPWRVLVICMLLNQTTGKQVKSILRRVFLLCPTAEAAVQIPFTELRTIIKPLGLQNKRARDIHKLSHEYLKDGWTHVTQLHGVGKYAADAYAIFCVGKPEDVVPRDHKLVKYWEYVIQWRRKVCQLDVGFDC